MGLVALVVWTSIFASVLLVGGWEPGGLVVKEGASHLPSTKLPASLLRMVAKSRNRTNINLDINRCNLCPTKLS